MKPEPPKGYYWVEGRLTRKQKTTRSDNCWTELWNNLTPKEQKEAQEAWKIEEPKIKAAREARNIPNHVLPEEEEAYTERLAFVKANFSIPEAPAMPTVSMAMICKQPHALREKAGISSPIEEQTELNIEWTRMRVEEGSS